MEQRTCISNAIKDKNTKSQTYFHSTRYRTETSGELYNTKKFVS